MAVTELPRRLLQFLLPATCLGCGELLEGRGQLGLCLPCAGRLRPVVDACDGCGRRLDAAAIPDGFRCGACRRSPPSYDRLLIGWSYEPPMDAVIRGLKFGRLEYLGRQLAQALADHLGDRIEEASVTRVTPVPLHWRRRWSRGYDQAACIAQPLARRLGLEYRPLLRRTRGTPPQSRLGRGARQRNLSRAFTPRRGTTPRDGAVLLIDDVITTGQTLRAAARALRRGGMRRIIALAAAHTP